MNSFTFLILATGTALGLEVPIENEYPRPNTGKSLYKQCSPVLGTPKKNVGGLYCSGYIMGIHDGLKERVDFCTYGDPPQYFVEQVMEYLNDHPTEWSQSAPTLIRKALIEANDC
ncbi:Rap1a/Tai family immunity protein [Kiloniella antarctica]|uniref:Rap1a/Tai family immunity protein n=1 Tax=Kiloniella antarctica TaxID=1550907 RepID=A0ABW5BJL6_9PROT